MRKYVTEMRKRLLRTEKMSTIIAVKSLRPHPTGQHQRL